MGVDTRQWVDRHGEERARAAVLETTALVLGEVGYQRLRVGAVAARAGVPRVWLRHWWTTRPLLVAEALQRMDDAPDIVRPATSTPTSGRSWYVRPPSSPIRSSRTRSPA